MNLAPALEAFPTSFVLVGPFVASLRPRSPGPTDLGNAREGVSNRSPGGPGVDVEGDRPAGRAAKGDQLPRRVPDPEGAVIQLARYKRVSRPPAEPAPT
jgi:hypothetical protein